jgi:GT2 family glycosyltransferase
MKLSVLMPVYNGQRYLAEAVDSVLGQSFGDFELIVVDDGSTDGTSEVLAGYGDPRLRVARTPHRGLIPALERAAAEAQGPYLARMDDDDRSDPRRFAEQVRVLDQRDDVALVTCYADLIDADGVCRGVYHPPLSDDLILDLAAGNPLVHGSVMMRRRDFLEAGGYSRAPEDYALWIRLARQGKRFAVVPDVLYAFRTHPSRYSLTHTRSQTEAILEVQRPLLIECMRTRDRSDPAVHAKLLRGWGRLGAAALLGGRPRIAERAARWVFRLDRKRPELHANDHAAFDDAAEALVWAGCPFSTALHLRLRQWRRDPLSTVRLRDLALCFPMIESARRRMKSWSKSGSDAG